MRFLLSSFVSLRDNLPLERGAFPNKILRTYLQCSERLDHVVIQSIYECLLDVGLCNGGGFGVTV
jgi:hypothetical protein